MRMLADQLRTLASLRRVNTEAVDECGVIMKEFLLREYRWA
jgi:hypothetical protein